MATFGSHLLARGAVSPEQLREATRIMVVFGGRLGTVLAESGILTLEQVEDHLAAHLDLPVAPPERLARPDPEALELISVDQARRHAVLPLWIEKRTLHAAMASPQEANQVDALAFATGLTIAPYVIAERRLVDLLERFYGIRPDPRFTDYRILDLAGHVQPAQPDPQPVRRRAAAREPDPAEAAAAQRNALGLRPLEAGEELSRGDELEAAQDTAPTAAARSTAEVAELESQLVLLAPRREVPRLVCRIGAFYARAAAFFAVRDERIRGLEAAGELTGERLAGIYLPVSAPSLLSRPLAAGRLQRSRPGADAVDAELMRALGRAPREVAVLPIRLGDRIASLLYVDNGADPLASSALAALEGLAETAAAAYERLLLASLELATPASPGVRSSL